MGCHASKQQLDACYWEQNKGNNKSKFSLDDSIHLMIVKEQQKNRSLKYKPSNVLAALEQGNNDTGDNPMTRRLSVATTSVTEAGDDALMTSSAELACDVRSFHEDQDIEETIHQPPPEACQDNSSDSLAQLLYHAAHHNDTVDKRDLQLIQKNSIESR